MRVMSGLTGLLIAGVASAALAGEPTKLTDGQMDEVSAGLFEGFAFAFTNPSFLQGSSATLFELSQTQTISQTTLAPPTFNSTFQALAQSQVQNIANGVGFTQAAGGGGTQVTISLIDPTP